MTDETAKPVMSVVPYQPWSRKPGSGGARPGAGRPRQFDRETLLDLLYAYIEFSQHPKIAEFAYYAGISKAAAFAMPELAEGLALLKTKRR